MSNHEDFHFAMGNWALCSGAFRVDDDGVENCGLDGDRGLQGLAYFGQTGGFKVADGANYADTHGLVLIEPPDAGRTGLGDVLHQSCFCELAVLYEKVVCCNAEVGAYNHIITRQDVVHHNKWCSLWNIG